MPETPSTTRVAQSRQRKREAGLVPMEIWIPEGDKELLKEFVAKRIKKHERTANRAD